MGYWLIYYCLVCEAVEYDTPEKIINGKVGLKNLMEENRNDLEVLGLMVKK